MLTLTRPMNAEQTSRLARRYEGALLILSNPSYIFTPFQTNPKAFYVEKEECTIYTVSVTNCYCSCPDFEKHRDFCKHLLAAEELLMRNSQMEGYDPNEESGRDEYPL